MSRVSEYEKLEDFKWPSWTTWHKPPLPDLISSSYLLLRSPPAPAARRSSQNDSAWFSPGLPFGCSAQKRWKRNRKQADKNGTQYKCTICARWHGGVWQEKRAHRNPLMEPDYLFALKLIECREGESEWGGGACVVVTEGDIWFSLSFSPFFKQILLCLHRERQMGFWEVGCMNVRGCDPAGVCCWSSDTAWKRSAATRDKLFSSHFQPHHKLHPIILIVTPPPPRSFLSASHIHTYPAERRGSYPVLRSLSGLSSWVTGLHCSESTLWLHSKAQNKHLPSSSSNFSVSDPSETLWRVVRLSRDEYWKW